MSVFGFNKILFPFSKTLDLLQSIIGSAISAAVLASVQEQVDKMVAEVSFGKSLMVIGGSVTLGALLFIVLGGFGIVAGPTLIVAGGAIAFVDWVASDVRIRL